MCRISEVKALSTLSDILADVSLCIISVRKGVEREKEKQTRRVLLLLWRIVDHPEEGLVCWQEVNPSCYPRLRKQKDCFLGC